MVAPRKPHLAKVTNQLFTTPLTKEKQSTQKRTGRGRAGGGSEGVEGGRGRGGRGKGGGEKHDESGRIVIPSNSLISLNPCLLLLLAAPHLVLMRDYGRREPLRRLMCV